MNTLPRWLREACASLRSHFHKTWDADDSMSDEYVMTTPIGQLVIAFTANSPTTQNQLALLAMFAARRALPCWSLYCDTDQPIETVEAIRRWLVKQEEQDWSRFIDLARPSEHGVPIVDCRACDTGCVADAASQAARFIHTGNLLHAIYSLSAADMAFDQSPIGSTNNYRQWFIDIAVPAAFAERELTIDEQTAFLDCNSSAFRRTGKAI